jgi:hypothetical protein
VKSIRITLTLLAIVLVCHGTTRAQDPLPSWNDGPAQVDAYGIPPEQIVGCAGAVKHGYDKGGKPIPTKESKLLLNDNDAGKPEGIHLEIGSMSVRAAMASFVVLTVGLMGDTAFVIPGRNPRPTKTV